ncbi:hypothetical protein EV126DRAFT_423118 [Verticillium dahliae]|nr:hypothetical protein EV126DRAFT_423118 [Verticillium dahliae]
MRLWGQASIGRRKRFTILPSSRQSRRHVGKGALATKGHRGKRPAQSSSFRQIDVLPAKVWPCGQTLARVRAGSREQGAGSTVGSRGVGAAPQGTAAPSANPWTLVRSMKVGVQSSRYGLGEFKGGSGGWRNGQTGNAGAATSRPGSMPVESQQMVKRNYELSVRRQVVVTWTFRLRLRPPERRDEMRRCPWQGKIPTPQGTRYWVGGWRVFTEESNTSVRGDVPRLNCRH